MADTETTPADTSDAPTGPAAPFARITGRLILPDGTPAAGTTLTLDPLPCKVSARLTDGPALIGSRVRTTLDEHGRVASKAGKFVDVIGCGEGVSPAGSWAYMVRLSGAGVDWRGVAILRAGSTTDLTDILAGLAAPSGGGAVDDAALKALAEKLDKLHDELHGEHWQGLELDPRDDGAHVQFGGLKPFREAFDDSMITIQASLDEVTRLPGRMDTIDSTVSSLEGIPERVTNIEKGPYKVAGLSANGGRRDPVERDLAKTMTHISDTFEDMGGVIRNVSTEEVYKALYGSEETGVIGPLTEYSEIIAGLNTRLKAVEESGGVPGPAGPAGPQGEPGAGVREQTVWTNLTNLPANLVQPGDGNGVYVRRHGNIVYMAIRGADPAAGVVKFDVPDGYKHSFSMAAMGVLIPCDDAKLAGKLQFGHKQSFEWKGAAGVTDLGYGVLSYPTNDPWPES